MRIIKDDYFLMQLFNILRVIAKDKKSAAKKFEKDINTKLELLKENPQMCRKSYHFEDESYRDLIYSGYTVIYKIEKDAILILEIFKWQER